MSVKFQFEHCSLIDGNEVMDRCLLLKNPENVEEFTNIRRIFTAVVRHVTIFYYDCEDSTKTIETIGFVKNPRKLVKNPGKLVKNPENFEELTKIEEPSHSLLKMGTIHY